ncbi:14904_t:CDS:1, partial [Cetraspora pellucida]
HYLDIVEPDRHSKKTLFNEIKQKNIESIPVSNILDASNLFSNNGLTFMEQIQILTKVLYKH